MSALKDHLQLCFRCWNNRDEVFEKLDKFIDAVLDDREENGETRLIQRKSTFTKHSFHKLKLLLQEAWESRQFERVTTVLLVFHFLADCQGDLRGGFDVLIRHGIVDVLKQVWSDVVEEVERQGVSDSLTDVGCEVINTLTGVTDYSKKAKLLVVEKFLIPLLEAVRSKSIAKNFGFRTKVMHFAVGLLERCEGESEMTRLLKTPGLLERLANVAMAISQLGDIEHQLSMTEMLLLMTSDIPERRRQLSHAFGTKDAETKFMSISMNNLEEDALSFLMLLNSQQEAPNLVKSYACIEACIGNHLLKCPYVDKSLGIIVHVNIGSRRIVMFVKAAEFQLSQDVDNPDCGTVAIQFDDIESVQAIVSPVNILQQHLQQMQEERESVSASSVHIGEAAPEASVRRTAVAVHESISSFPIHIPVPSNRDMTDEQSDSNADNDLSKLQTTPEHQPIDGIPSPRTSTPQPESVLSQTSGKTPDCETIETENSPIQVPNEHILVIDTQLLGTEEIISEDANPTQSGPKIIPSSQPDIDKSGVETQMSRHTPVAAVKGRRKGESSPSPSTLVHTKSKVASKKPKKTEKAVERVRKPSKSKPVARNTKQQEETSRDVEKETVPSRTRRLRPPRNSKTIAAERLKVSALPSEPESGEEGKYVSEYQPPKKKERQTAVELNSPEKNEEVEPPARSVSVPIHEASSETDGERSDCSGGLKQHSVLAEAPAAPCLGLVEWEDDDERSAGNDIEETQDKKAPSGVCVEKATRSESQVGNQRRQVKKKPKVQKEKQTRKRKGGLAPSPPQSLLEFTRAIIRQRYEQSQQFEHRSTPRHYEEAYNANTMQKRGESPSLQMSSTPVLKRVNGTQSSKPEQLKKKTLPSTGAAVDGHWSPHKKKNRGTKSPSKTFPAIPTDHRKSWTPAFRSGRRMGVLNVTTTPVSVKTPSSVQMSDSEEEKKENTKDEDVEETEEITEVAHVLPDHADSALVPDVGLEEEVGDNDSSGLPSHHASETLQDQDSRTFYLVTPVPYSLSNKQTSKDATSGYGSMFSPLESGPVSRKRPRQSPVNYFTSPAKSFDGNRNYSDESDDEGVDAESQPIARQLFRTPANVSGLASCASLSGVEDRDTSGHNTSAEVSGIFETFSRQIQKATNSKKKLMESFVHKVDGCIMQHVEEFVDARTKKRHQVLSHFFEQTSGKLTDLEKTVQRMRKTGKRLESLFTETMNALDGCLNEQKENVADVKLIQDQFDCHMSGLVDEDRDEQSMKVEMQQELASLQETMSRECQHQELTSLRRSLQSMIMDM